MAILVAGAALAATPPLPISGKVYDNGAVDTTSPSPSLTAAAKRSKVELTFAVSPSNAKRIESGVPDLSGTAHSSGYLECPNSSLIAGFPFPGATLKLSRGKYRFSATETEINPGFIESLFFPPKGTLKLRIEGTVTSAARITGTVTVGGDLCKAGTLHYSLALSSKLQG